MKPLPNEIEQRFGVAEGILLPVTVTTSQLGMLRAAEQSSADGINLLVVAFVGAKLVAHSEPYSQRYKLPEVRLPGDILDLEVFETSLKQNFLAEYEVEIEISRYVMMVHCTFMDDQRTEEEGPNMSSRTLHIFTARVPNADEWQEELSVSEDSPIRLVKPRHLLDSLHSEWSDVKTQLSSGLTRYSDMKAEYDESWAFVRARTAALVFKKLYNWELPEI